MKNRFFIITLFIFAFIVRLIPIMILPVKLYQPVGDCKEYDSIAMNILGGKGFSLQSAGETINHPVLSRTPLYPLLLSGVYYAFGHNYTAVRVTQAILSSLSCIVLFFIGAIMFNTTVGMISSLLMAVYPPFIFYLYYGGPTFLMPDTLFVLLLQLGILALMYFWKNKRITALIFSAVFIGLAALTRPIIFYFSIFIFAWLVCIKNYELRYALRSGFIFLAVFILTIAPWTLRNYLVTGRFVAISTLGGATFWGGNNSMVRGGMIAKLDILPEYNEKEFSGLSEVERESRYLHKGLDFLRTHAKRVPYLLVKKVLVHWNIFNEKNEFNLPFALIISFTFVAMVISLFKKSFPDYSLLLLLFLYSTVIAIISAGAPRYRYYMEPFIIISASAGMAGLFSLKPRLKSILIFSCIVFINIIFALNSTYILNWGKSVF